jgi:Trk K+ transport system NAD-binding subunit
VTGKPAGGEAILIVGDDVLAQRVCSELAAAGEANVRVVAPAEADNDAALLEAGVAQAASILTLSGDDERNLSIALRARMLNPRIRVVLRQFSTKIGRKIEQNLPDSTVLSLAAHSAATYAGAALDPGCLFALRFPDAVDGEFVGFTQASALALGLDGLTVEDAEARLGQRVVALGSRREPPPGALIDGPDAIVAFGPVRERRKAVVRRDRATQQRPPVGAMLEALRHINPILRAILLGSVTFFAIAFVFFRIALHLSWGGTAFDVAQMMTSAGLSDARVIEHGWPVTAGAVLFMIGGTIFTTILIGYVSAAISRAQWTALQGLRRVRGHGHVVVCGGGRIGSAVVNLLTEAGKHVVVIDSHPDPTLVRRARQSSIDLLTGDATNEEVLALCDVPHAAAVVVLTNSDPGNLEIALGVRDIRADVPLVVRMENRTFAQATARLFGIATFSPAALSAPAFAGLARLPGTLGRVSFGGGEYTIVQQTEVGDVHPPAADAIPLGVWRAGRVRLIHGIAEIVAGDVAIYALPLAPGIVGV